MQEVVAYGARKIHSEFSMRPKGLIMPSNKMLLLALGLFASGQNAVAVDLPNAAVKSSKSHQPPP